MDFPTLRGWDNAGIFTSNSDSTVGNDKNKKEFTIERAQQGLRQETTLKFFKHETEVERKRDPDSWAVKERKCWPARPERWLLLRGRPDTAARDPPERLDACRVTAACCDKGSDLLCEMTLLR